MLSVLIQDLHQVALHGKGNGLLNQHMLFFHRHGAEGYLSESLAYHLALWRQSSLLSGPLGTLHKLNR